MPCIRVKKNIPIALIETPTMIALRMRTRSGIDANRQRVGVGEHTGTSQHVRYEIVGKQRQRREIIEATEAAVPKSPVKIGRSDLRAFVQRNVQLTIRRNILIERHLRERIHESLRRSVRILDDGFETIVKLRCEPDPEISPRARIEPHQFRNLGVTHILSEQIRHRLRRGRSKRLTGPAPVRLEAFSAGGRDRSIAGHLRSFSQRGEPTGTKIDRVEGDHEGEGLRVITVEEMCRIQVVLRPALTGKTLGKVLKALVVDTHGLRAPGHLGTTRTNLLE